MDNQNDGSPRAGVYPGAGRSQISRPHATQALLEAQKTFRRLKAYRQLPILRNALQEHLRKAQADSAIETIMKAA